MQGIVSGVTEKPHVFQLNIFVEMKERLIVVILELQAWTINARNISSHSLKYKKMVYWFPIAALTNYHLPSGLKQHRFIILRFQTSQAYTRSLALLFFRRLWGVGFLPFPDSRVMCIPWLMVPCSVFKVSGRASSLRSDILLPCKKEKPYKRTLVVTLAHQEHPG